LPWVVAAVGLVATHLLSEARERRKEIRAQLDRLVERLAALEDRGMKFHAASSFEAAAARAIETDIASIERRATRLLASAMVSFEDKVIAHRQSLTLENFAQSNFSPQEPSSAILREIAVATAEYEEALEAGYRTQYPSNFPYYSMGSNGFTEVFGTLVAACVGVLMGATWMYLALQP
jgi:hypothetical protein